MKFFNVQGNRNILTAIFDRALAHNVTYEQDFHFQRRIQLDWSTEKEWDF